MSDSTNTQSVCKHCGQPIRCTKRFASDWEDKYGVFCSALSGLKYHEPVAEPASTGEPPPQTSEWDQEYPKDNRFEEWPLTALHPSGPSALFCQCGSGQRVGECDMSHAKPPASQTSAEYLNKCVKEGPDCDCVTVCKFDPQPVSGDMPKVEEIARQIIELESQRNLYAESNWREEYPKLIAAILRPYLSKDKE